ncbi:hypothetical protein DEJ23_13330 [Curtobacterium sp. MCSS17_008]|uniref:hypothetical protein n=1 Tax=Curtobacterium sp. MCSS17_008 TaxID=2175647 RepID=UPI000DA6F95C|nr:hypothetical protein [Curtobacterium sp. MCSS17_008]PZF54117.1 hypothetical protein DEJ23_13330 [Curtobacterium sp. MCSS17_008]
MRSTPAPTPTATATVLAIVVSVLALTGCSAGGSTRVDAMATADRFLRDVAHGDGRAACALLVPDAREDVEDRTGRSCADGVTALDLPTPEDGRTQVYGRAAIVESDRHAVFLARSGDSWLVRAAGCRPVPDAPYECTVDGS